MMGWLFRLWFIFLPVTLLGLFCWFGPILQPAYRVWVGSGILIAEVIFLIIWMSSAINELH